MLVVGSMLAAECGADFNRLPRESRHGPSRGVVVSISELRGGIGRLIRCKALKSDFHHWQSGAMADLDDILIQRSASTSNGAGCNPRPAQAIRQQRRPQIAQTLQKIGETLVERTGLELILPFAFDFELSWRSDSSTQ